MNLLLLEDDADLRNGLRLALGDAGHQVQAVSSLEAAQRLIDRVDAVITDVNLPGCPDAGIRLIAEVKPRQPTVEVLVMTGYASVPQAVEAMRLGARSYLPKPFDIAVLVRMLSEIETLRGLRESVSGRGALVGSSAAMRRVYRQIDVAAASELTVLIRGETGSGKELAARAIHRLSQRRARPFVAVNCAAIPRELAESELFGHEAGAFTGAVGRRTGCFANAADGVLLLDEINSLPLELQPKLLRVLEESEFQPVGATKPLRLAARVLAASNADLEALVAAGRFRQDLFYRLQVLEVVLPPLRERPEDIPSIAAAILEREAPGGRPCHLVLESYAALLSRSWPGNVRELANQLRRALAVATEAQPTGAVEIRPEHLGGGGLPDLPFKEAQERACDEWSRRTVIAALATCGGGMTEAAERLRMDRSALYKLVKRLGIPIPGSG